MSARTLGFLLASTILCASSAWALLSPAAAQDTTEVVLADHERRIAALEALLGITPTPTATPTPAPAPTAIAGFFRQEHQVGEWSILPGDCCIRWQFRLRPYMWEDTLPQSVLDELDAGLNFARANDRKVILRFSYWFNEEPTDVVDVPYDRLAKHIDQLAPVVNRHKDVVFVLEAGFIGRWGEWHYWQVPVGVYGERSAPTAARRQALEKILASFQTPVSLRYPKDIRWAKGFLPAADYLRLGFHNDYLLGDTAEGGTWGTGDRTWMTTYFFNTPRIVTGEMHQTVFSDSQLKSAYTGLAQQKLQVLNRYNGVAIHDRLRSFIHPSGGSYWDHLVAHLGNW